MSVKAKKRLIVVLATLLILIGGGALGVNLYIDSILNKMDQTDSFSDSDVGANKLDKNVTNIALLGIDNDSGTDIQRSDVMKLVSLNFKQKKIKITSLQRDNLVYIPMQEKYDKLNHGYRDDGAKGALSAINYNFDLNVTQYVKFSFDSVVQIVNMIGGVSINLNGAEAASLGLPLGVQILNGEEALAYSRIRNIDSDYGRMQRQNNVINSILASMSGKSAFELLDIVTSVMPYVETNISNGQIKSYVTRLVSFDFSDIEQFQFPSEGYNSIQSSISLYGYGPLYILKDFSGEVELLHKNIYGKDYKASDTVKKVESDTKDYLN